MDHKVGSFSNYYYYLLRKHSLLSSIDTLIHIIKESVGLPFSSSSSPIVFFPLIVANTREEVSISLWFQLVMVSAVFRMSVIWPPFHLFIDRLHIFIEEMSVQVHCLSISLTILLQESLCIFWKLSVIYSACKYLSTLYIIFAFVVQKHLSLS